MPEITAARAAAAWWVRQLVTPTFRSTTVEEERADPDTALRALFGRSWAHQQADEHPATDEQLLHFGRELEKIIIRDTRDDGYHYGLHTDYGPDTSLAEAADLAGIHKSRFPHKSHSWTNHGQFVTVRLGYAAPTRLIWSAPGWVRPACDQLRAERRPGGLRYDYVYFSERCTKPVYHEDDCGDWAADTAVCAYCGDGQADHYNGEPRNHCFERRSSA